MTIGVMRDRKSKPAGDNDDLGRMPTEFEFALKAGEIAENLERAQAEEADLEGELAGASVFVNGKKIRLSTLRTQEHVGLLLAEATREQIETDAHYRAWRARTGLELCQNAKKDLQQWRVKQRVEAMPDFLTYKTALAKAAANAIALRTVYETWGDE